jgi:hypothetical protein
VPSSDENFDRQFEIVVSGAERTRGILYFFCLVLIVNMVFFFEDAFNTADRRVEIMSGANACIGANLGPDDKVPLAGYDKGACKKAFCRFYYDYVGDYYHIKIPFPRDASGTLDSFSKEAFTEKYKAVLRDATDSLSTNVPLLNIKIDRNTGLILQNSLGILVLFILALSIQAEAKALVTATEMIGTDDYFRAKAILDTHVFSRISAGRVFLFSAAFAPATMQLYRIYQDFLEINVAIDVYGTLWGLLYLAFETGSLVLVFFVALHCFWKAKELVGCLERVEEKIGVAPEMYLSERST